MSWRSTLGTWLFARELDDDFARAWNILKNNPEAVVVGLGVFLRVIVYLSGRSFWMDEASLWENLAGKPIFDFSEPLSGNQLAPLGFLSAQRAVMSVLGVSTYASRLLPLACGLLSLVLFARLARRILARRPALIALILFSFSDDLIYYSSELKPYSLDLAIGLAVSLIALETMGKPISMRQAALLTVAAVEAPWFSFASAFVVVGCGATLILTCVLSRRPRDAAVWIVIGIGWLVSFLISYRASLAIVIPYVAMYRFWYFAFLPVWPLPMDQARLAVAAGILLEIFVTPLNLVAPVWPWAGIVVPVVLLLLGGWSLARRARADWAILVLPIALAMLASAMKRYPIHGRLILELVPSFFLLIAEGTELLRGPERGRIKLGYRLFLILLFTYPCLMAFQNAVSVPIRNFNIHGDLRKNIFME
jgi:hypothetical protein